MIRMGLLLHASSAGLRAPAAKGINTNHVASQRMNTRDYNCPSTYSAELTSNCPGFSRLNFFTTPFSITIA